MRGIVPGGIVPLGIFALAALGLTPAAAQEPGSRPTREYVQAAGQSDTFEMLEARTALAQSTDDGVRAFAQHMLDEHAGTSRALRDATARADLAPPPMAMSDDQARLLGALQGMRGEEFDRAYGRHQALAHRSALTVQQQYAASGDDAVIRQVATAAVPVIAAHLAAAEQLASRLEAR